MLTYGFSALPFEEVDFDLVVVVVDFALSNIRPEMRMMDELQDLELSFPYLQLKQCL